MRVQISCCLLCVLLCAGWAFAADDHGGPTTPVPYAPGIVMTKAVQAGITPDAAVNILKAGNRRFADGTPLSRDALLAAKETAAGQFPFASILSCIDSRVPVELIFDQNVGDVFVARVAGNVVDSDVLGSLEYASKAAGARVIVVLGHLDCGAVKGACDHVKMGNLTALLDKIQPAVNSVPTSGERDSRNRRFVDDVIRANVELAMRDIRAKSPILKEMEQSGAIRIVGGVYDVASGRVAWF